VLLEFEKQVDKEQKHLHIAVLFDVLNLRFAWANILVNKPSKNILITFLPFLVI